MRQVENTTMLGGYARHRDVSGVCLFAPKSKKQSNQHGGLKWDTDLREQSYSITMNDKCTSSYQGYSPISVILIDSNQYKLRSHARGWRC